MTLEAGNEVVVVYQGVQNPQDQSQASDSEVVVTLNVDGSADEATGTVRYEWNAATVSMANQGTSGGTVTVDEAMLSEDGFVVVQNESGRSPDEIRGATYLEAGEHEDVEVQLDPSVSSDANLHAQLYLDTDGDHRFGYDGGLVDRPFETPDGNVMAADSAQISHTGDGSTDTRTATATPGEPTGTEDATAAPTTGGDGEAETNGDETMDETDSAIGDTGADDGTTEEATDGGGDADADGPGFGALFGLVALVAAAMLARHR